MERTNPQQADVVQGPNDGNRLITAPAGVRRVRALGFPTYEMVVEGAVEASLGRFSFLNIYFGRGQRIELADRTRWRLGAVGIGPNICPLIRNEERARVSQAMLRVGSYGINGRGYGYVLKPDEAPRWGRENRWVLLDRDGALAHFTRHPRTVVPIGPIPLATALLAFVLMEFGLPGEDAPRIPALKWGSPP